MTEAPQRQRGGEEGRPKIVRRRRTPLLIAGASGAPPGGVCPVPMAPRVPPAPAGWEAGAGRPAEGGRS